MVFAVSRLTYKKTSADRCRGSSWSGRGSARGAPQDLHASGDPQDGVRVVAQLDHRLLEALLPRPRTRPQRPHPLALPSLDYQGSVFEGISGTDQRCGNRAGTVGLPDFLGYRAWISDSKVSAKDPTFRGRGRYVLVNGLVVANSGSALVAGELQIPINVTETSETKNYQVWTGTMPDGTAAVGADQFARVRCGAHRSHRRTLCCGWRGWRVRSTSGPVSAPFCPVLQARLRDLAPSRGEELDE